MRKNHISFALVGFGLALAGVVACGGESPPPQSPADQTTTTGASTTTPGYGTPTTAVPMTPSSTDAVPQATTSTTTTPASPMGGIAGTTATPASGSDSTFSDAQIVGIVQAADRGEIEQGREANRKGKSGRVKSFAEHMIKDHSAAETKLTGLTDKAGIAPQSSSTSQSLMSNGAQLMVSLRAKSDETFDKAYMDAQVDEHTQVLRLLDDQLIPHAQNADLRKTLQDIRGKVADHLKMAQDIQSSLAKK